MMTDDILDHSEAASNLLKSMANSQRLRILCLLNKCQGELTVSELCDQLDLSMSALSQHLAKLRESHLVHTRRQAQTILYSVADGPAKAIISTLQHSFCNTGEHHG